MTAFRKPNRLLLESSPYLLQHANNPVDWYPWCEEAFEKAKKEEKPVFLSIGYSACHWCHVMKKESFEDEETAELMNRFYVCIKVDREERPEIDAIYMSAIQNMTGSGGWPMSVFLTPDGKPFFGGTYFPPEPRYGMPGFRKILNSVALFYHTKEKEVAEQTERLLEILNRKTVGNMENGEFDETLPIEATTNLESYIDPENGGFGSQPKFPQPMSIDFLLARYRKTKNPESLGLINLTLEKMAKGGIYDQLGGGFHRYSVDSVWLVPHFEKMLYDNAQLLRTYLSGWRTTSSPLYHRILHETVDYVLREMTDSEGGFFSTQDADSEGEEGKFFVWGEKEILDVLDKKEKRIFAYYYGVTECGNFEGKTILSIQKPLGETAEKAGFALEEAESILLSARRKLFAEREKRVKPLRDEKILTEWNGLMIHALAECGAIAGRTDALNAAKKAATFILGKMRQKDGKLYRNFKDGMAKLNACLEDYSSLIVGLIALYEATFERRWLERADELARIMIDEFSDTENGGFFQTGKSHEVLLVRRKDIVDNAVPSGNSLAAEALLKLSVYFGNTDYREMVRKLLSLSSEEAKRYPGGFGRMLSVYDSFLSLPVEVVIVGDKDSREVKEFVESARKNWVDNLFILVRKPEEEAWLPLMKGKEAIDGKATAYVCAYGTCKPPITDPNDLRELL